MLSDHCTYPHCSRKSKFVKLPDFIQTDARLVGCDLRLLARLIHYAWGSGVCWPSVRRLAEDLSLAERTIQIALGRLYKLGYVQTRSAANRTGREFVLQLDDRPVQPVAPPPPQAAAPPPLPAVAPESDVPSNQTHSSPRDVSPKTERQESPQPVSILAMTRILAAAGDPIAQRELARLETPKPPPAPEPESVEDLITRLDSDPTFRPRLASALADHWNDRKSYEFYWKVAMRYPRDAIARAFAGARNANSPPAMFTALLCRDPMAKKMAPQRGQAPRR